MVQIFFIYAEKCEYCKFALSVIQGAMIQCKEIPCEILKFHYDAKAAIGIASNNGINDLPGCVIGKEVFMGKNYSEEKIKNAIKKAAK
jgi:glutaredoxin